MGDKKWPPRRRMRIGNSAWDWDWDWDSASDSGGIQSRCAFDSSSGMHTDDDDEDERGFRPKPR